MLKFLFYFLKCFFVLTSKKMRFKKNYGSFSNIIFDFRSISATFTASELWAAPGCTRCWIWWPPRANPSPSPTPPVCSATACCRCRCCPCWPPSYPSKFDIFFLGGGGQKVNDLTKLYRFFFFAGKNRMIRPNLTIFQTKFDLFQTKFNIFFNHLWCNKPRKILKDFFSWLCIFYF